MLSDAMRDMAHSIAATGLFATSYDNINMVFRAAEQIIGCTGELPPISAMPNTDIFNRLPRERYMCNNLATLESQD
jgi:hypothetical protein